MAGNMHQRVNCMELPPPETWQNLQSRHQRVNCMELPPPETWQNLQSRHQRVNCMELPPPEMWQNLQSCDSDSDGGSDSDSDEVNHAHQGVEVLGHEELPAANMNNAVPEGGLRALDNEAQQKLMLECKEIGVEDVGVSFVGQME
eukprot:TRINITY_DN13535_c0_g1_i1.p1 TRINITY_DN13535_c0_g1~~TRINITY_DN13535_c0_g1_i1.p1  ORF type:complete len:145 (+),score=22.11 TRINITY_DN13535_c0_g1_i1:51-485(+)